MFEYFHDFFHDKETFLYSFWGLAILTAIVFIVVGISKMQNTDYLDLEKRVLNLEEKSPLDNK